MRKQLQNTKVYALYSKPVGQTVFCCWSPVSLEETIWTGVYLCVNWSHLSLLQYKCKAMKGEELWYEREQQE